MCGEFACGASVGGTLGSGGVMFGGGCLVGTTVGGTLGHRGVILDAGGLVMGTLGSWWVESGSFHVYLFGLLWWCVLWMMLCVSNVLVG